ncbi:DUF814 domain-containing protein [Desulfovibrio inopinatus]|uniref:DUF814 domain-containing protein n=1 Tax=Desulfovibrio inopinatus TaxID=102109 RepID=UPI00048952F3|nr:DUF814 domain-containing protein [Desulfovibrio inopinatus]
MKHYDALALFSGGLDSILAAKTVVDQGLKVLCLHFVSPFFGHPDLLAHWKDVYDLDIIPVDVSEEFTAMLASGPDHGVGKVLNPCIDCKILMLGKAKTLLSEYGAEFLITGEVKGQRPMSQRMDALNIISRDAGVRGVLLRPLSAKKFDPTPMELAGVVDRERLHNIGGRGRKDQLALANAYDLKEIPTPAGGCLLTEAESAKRYFPILKYFPQRDPNDFRLANIGRQYWAGRHWLAIGRNQADNTALEQVLESRDLVFKTKGFPGPLAVGRQPADGPWSETTVRDAAAFVASFSPKAVRSGQPIEVYVRVGHANHVVTITPSRETPLGWADPDWETAKAEKSAFFAEAEGDD